LLFTIMAVVVVVAVVVLIDMISSSIKVNCENGEKQMPYK